MPEFKSELGDIPVTVELDHYGEIVHVGTKSGGSVHLDTQIIDGDKMVSMDQYFRRSIEDCMQEYRSEVLEFVHARGRDRLGM